MTKYVAWVLALACVAACSTTDREQANSKLVPVFNAACSGLTSADAMFQQTSPLLLAEGKLSQLDLDKERAIFQAAQSLCVSPPTDIASGTTALLGQAASIYLLLQAAK